MENKTSKYFKYAIGEIILVVIGILIALQINNWNVKRIERQREVSYLKNIKLDLQKDLTNLIYMIEFRQDKFERTQKILSQINGSPTSNIDQLAKDVYFTIMEERFTPNNSTYNELSNSGNLNLIANDSIKKLLLDLQEIYKYNDAGIDHETYEYREYISKSLFSYVDLDLIKPIYEEEKTAREQNIDLQSFQSLFQSLEYKNGLVISITISKDFIPFYDKIKSKSETIIELINRDIEKP
ncbi:DUF6090 family protein [Winogradskyella aurantia]|nr:DUF6090 family protein [Winogradskyella aurantia]